MWFEVILGLKINLDKRELILVEGMDDIDDLALKFGCKVGNHPSSYWVFHWAHHLNLWWLGMEWKKGFIRGWPCGRDNTYPKEGELP